MKNKKSLLTISLLVLCAFALAACSPATTAETPSATASPAASETPSETPSASQPEASAQTSGEPAAMPEEQAPVTLSTLGKITEVLDDGDQIHVLGDNEANTANDIIANINDDTIIIDSQTGRIVDDDTLKAGDMVEVTVSSAMTKSLPPISNAYMVVTNISEDLLGIPSYIIAEEVTVNEDGSVTILNQNMDTYVTIAADMQLDVIEDDGDPTSATMTPSDLKKGDIVLAWYDVVALSYPAQANADRASVIIPDV